MQNKDKSVIINQIKGLEDTVVNQTIQSTNEESLEFTSTVPLSKHEERENSSFKWVWGEGKQVL